MSTLGRHETLRRRVVEAIGEGPGRSTVVGGLKISGGLSIDGVLGIGPGSLVFASEDFVGGPRLRVWLTSEVRALAIRDAFMGYELAGRVPAGELRFRPADAEGLALLRAALGARLTAPVSAWQPAGSEVADEAWFDEASAGGCPACGHVNEVHFRFCLGCGADLEAGLPGRAQAPSGDGEVPALVQAVPGLIVMMAMLIALMAAGLFAYLVTSPQ